MKKFDRILLALMVGSFSLVMIAIAAAFIKEAFFG